MVFYSLCAPLPKEHRCLVVGKKNGHTHRFCFFDALPPPPVDFGVVCPATSALLPPPVGLPSPCAVELMKKYIISKPTLTPTPSALCSR